MPKRIKQYAGIGSSGDIYIEKKRKTFKGDPHKLLEDWKSTQRENTYLKDRVVALETKLNSFEGIGGIKEQLENRILGLQNAHGETFKSLQDRLNSQERFINQQAKEISRARNYEKLVRKGLDDLEQECQKSLGNLKTWTENQIKKWLVDIEPWFKKTSLNELYDLINKGFYAWINSKKDVESWKTAYELEKVKTKGLEKNINTILTKWEAKNLTELSAYIQTINNNLIQEQNKSKQLEIQITNKDNDIKNKDKTIQSLQLKNEKLSDSYKKLIQHLADARLLVSHLQKDLQTEKQDKAHIQKELDDALAILNKPTAEMGTQTDLTAEQITQMEQDLADKNNKVSELQGNLNDLTNQIDTLQNEIKGLQKQVKDKETNETEKELLGYVKRGIETPFAGTIPPNELLEKLQNESKWTFLRSEYEIVRQKLIKLTKRELERRDLATKITKLAKDKEELQNKYDMEVRSKEELVKYLTIYRKSKLLYLHVSQDEVNLQPELASKKINDFLSQHLSNILEFLIIDVERERTETKYLTDNVININIPPSFTVYSIEVKKSFLNPKKPNFVISGGKYLLNYFDKSFAYDTKRNGVYYAPLTGHFMRQPLFYMGDIYDEKEKKLTGSIDLWNREKAGFYKAERGDKNPITGEKLERNMLII